MEKDHCGEAVKMRWGPVSAGILSVRDGTKETALLETEQLCKTRGKKIT